MVEEGGSHGRGRLAVRQRSIAAGWRGRWWTAAQRSSGLPWELQAKQWYIWRVRWTEKLGREEERQPGIGQGPRSWGPRRSVA